ncbi:hypothetical protein SKAU_G00401900 [Synaphobranchus kaupii]|uniref:Uncharacterized protein n=1 Tax=Synaphobranchus kaupii TaxID=118154 RepID=A0A9Q1E998_SYNKA|nr:hypothetical protein SKAU_G00401900 [Synaphobranchus kaupii]
MNVSRPRRGSHLVPISSAGEDKSCSHARQSLPETQTSQPRNHDLQAQRPGQVPAERTHNSGPGRAGPAGVTDVLRGSVGGRGAAAA